MKLVFSSADVSIRLSSTLISSGMMVFLVGFSVVVVFTPTLCPLSLVLVLLNIELGFLFSGLNNELGFLSRFLSLDTGFGVVVEWDGEGSSSKIACTMLLSISLSDSLICESIIFSLFFTSSSEMGT